MEASKLRDAMFLSTVLLGETLPLTANTNWKQYTKKFVITAKNLSSLSAASLQISNMETDHLLRCKAAMCRYSYVSVHSEDHVTTLIRQNCLLCFLKLRKTIKCQYLRFSYGGL